MANEEIAGGKGIEMRLTRRRSRFAVYFFAVLLSNLLLGAQVLRLHPGTAPPVPIQIASPPLNESCTATVLNRLVQVNPNGTFLLANVPVPPGSFRVRVVCERNGKTEIAASAFVTGVPNGETKLGPFTFGVANPIPVSLALTSPAVTLTPTANGAQVVTTGKLVDGTNIDLTLNSTGTFYLTSNPAIATVTKDGFVRAVSSGRVLITATHEGVIGTIEIAVNLTQDADGDGIPDDYETANALNPGGANLARLTGTTVNASSASQAATRAIDGSVQTSWFTVVGDAANKRTVPFLEIVLPQDTNVAQMRVLGNRQNPTGFAFLAGRFQAFNSAGVEVFNSGIVNIPGPRRDLAVPVDLNGIRRVRFTSTADESNTPGLSEFQVISRPGGTGLNKNSGNDATLDFDNDGLTNLQEYQRGTSIFLNDTDGDGLDDGVEVTRGTNPLLADTDNDGLNDGDEVALGTNPTKADTDGDGIPDGAEVAAGLSPFSQDSNGNGIPDGSEDSDGDGLTNFDEIRENLDMNNPDSDGDGLSDGEELRPGVDGYITDPRRKDTDGDGMWDGFESKYGLNPTNPNDASGDPDGDGFTNLQEFQNGTDPRNPDVTAPTVSQITPTNSATDVAVNSVIVVRFPERMQPESVVADTVRLLEGTLPLQGTITLSSDRLSITFAPSARLTPTTDYTVQVQNLRDEAGNKMTALFTSAFRTGVFVDTEAPTVLTTSFPNGASGVPVNAPYTVEFSERMDPATLTTTTFSLRDNTTGLNVAGMIQVDPGRQSASFVPNAPLAIGRSHSVFLTSGIKDAAGNALGARGFSFTTAFTPDTTRPTFLSGSPAAGDTGVPINALVTLQFDEPLNLVNYKPGIQISAAGTPVAGAFALSDGNRRVTFTSASALSPDTLFTVNITSAVTDLVGNPLNNPASFTFRTGNTADLVSPAITQVEPANGSTNVGINAGVTLTFSEAMNPATINAATFLVHHYSTGILVPGTVAVATNRRSATFTPSAPLLGNTQYYIAHIYYEMADVTGRTLNGAFSFSTFTTAATADTTAPTLLSTSPVGGATGVPVNARVQLAFSEPISSTSLATAVVTFNAGATTVPGATSLATNGLTLTFTPAAALSANTAYTFSITGLTDRSGNPLGPVNLAFTTSTSATPDTTGPMLLTMSPANGATGVATNTPIVLTFSEPISPASIDASSVNGSRTIALFATVGTSQVAIPASASVAGAVVTLTPLAPLPPNARIDVYIVYNDYPRDLVGNISQSYQRTFNTATGTGDTTPPTVLSVTPGTGATGIGLNAAVTVQFSEPVTLPFNSIGLFNGSQRLSTGFSPSADGRMATITTTLPASSVISVAATPDVRDLAGNPLADFVSQFTTGPGIPSGSFSIISQRPASGSSSVPPNTPVSLIANRQLRASTVADSFFVSVNGTAAAGSKQLSPDGTTLIFTPATPFPAGALIQTFVTPTLQDSAGNPYNTNYATSFTIAPDPLTGTFNVARVNPASFVTSGIALNQAFDVQFSRPVDPATAVTANIRLILSSTAAPVPATYSVRNGNTVHIVPSAPLTATTQYYFNVNTGLKDTASGSFPSNQNFSFFTTGSAADTLPATFTRFAPFDGATGVGTNAFVRIASSKVLNPLSLNAATVTFSQGGTPLPISIATAGDNLSSTFSPLGPLAPNSLVTVTLNGLEDRAGNAMAPVTSTFRTGNGPDIVAPSRLLTSVTSGQTNVPVNSTFTANYDEPIDISSVNPSTFYVRDNVTGTILPGAVFFSSDGKQITFTPVNALAIGRSFTFLTFNIQDLAGNVGPSFFVSFTASFDADTTRPTVSRMVPVSGQTLTPTNAQIQIEFNEPVQATSLGSINLLAAGAPLSITRQLDSGNRIVTLIPNLLLAPGTVHSLSIAEVRDTSGNAMTGTVNNTFTTAPGVDLVTPTVTVQTPSSGATNVPRDVTIRVEFSERVNPLSIAEGTNFFLYNANTSANVPVAINTATDLRSMTFTPLTPLQPQTSYVIYFYSWLDLAGNYGSNPFYGVSFRTGDTLGSGPAPTVTQVFPVNGATGVPTNVKPAVRFSEPMDPASITGAFQTVPSSTGNLALSSDGLVLRYTPSGNLAPNTLHSFTISGVRDRTGRTMTPFNASFSTGAAADTTSPTITSVNPANGATAVPVATAIVLNTSEPIDPLSVDASGVNSNRRSIRIAATVSGTTVEIPASASVSGNVITLTPLSPLPGGAAISIQSPYNDYLRDAAGNLLGGFGSSFTTASVTDTTPPTVTSVTPADGTTGVGRNAPVTITFSEPINPSTVRASTVSLFNGATALSDSVSLGADGRSITLTTTLPADSTITVAVTDGIKDLSGNAVVAFTSGFSTALDIPAGGPFVTNQRPTGGAVPTDTPITLVFNRRMNPTTTAGAIRVSENGLAKAGSASLSADGLTLIFIPAARYAFSAIIQVFVTESATDISGVALGAKYTGQFAVVNDPTAASPSPSRVNPSNGTSIPLNQTFEVEFNEPLDPATITTANFFLRQNTTGSPTVAATLSLRNGNTTVRLVPSANLLPSTSYTLIINTGIHDASGTAVTSQLGYSWSTTTSAETVPPTVTAISPPGGSTNIGTNASIRVKFSEAMNPVSLRVDSVQITVGGSPVPALSFSLSGDGTDLTIVPNSFLPSNATVAVALTSAATDRAGNALTPANASFVTGPGANFVSPTPVSYSVIQGSTNVPLNADPAVLYNQPLDPRYVNATSVVLRDNSTSTNVAGTVSLSGDGRLIAFVPAANLKPNTSYSFFLTASLFDLSGNFANSFGESFTTSGTADTTPPQIASASPAAGSTVVPTNAMLRLVFDEPVDGTLLGGIVLRQGAATRAATVTLESNGRVVRIVPALLLAPNAAHTIDVSGVKDIAGNAAAATSIGFTTEATADLAAPVVSAYSPTYGSSGVARTVQPTITFTERLSPFSISSVSNIQLSNNVGAIIPATLSLSADGRTITITPTSQLAGTTQHSISGTVYDQAGNAVGTFFFFTTAP